MDTYVLVKHAATLISVSLTVQLGSCGTCVGRRNQDVQCRDDWSYDTLTTRERHGDNYETWTEQNYCIRRLTGNYIGKPDTFSVNEEERLWYWKTCFKVDPDRKFCYPYERLFKTPKKGVHGSQWGSLKLYPVKYKGEFLFGWLYFRWTPDREQVKPSRDETTIFVVQAETSDPNKTQNDDTPVSHAYHGRFFHHLHQENAPNTFPLKGDVAICSFAQDPAAEVATAFQLVYGRHGIDWEGVMTPAPKEISGFHQMNFPLCPVFGHEGLDTKLWFRAVHDHRERPSQFNAHEYYEETPLTDALSLKYWVFGAADPKPPRGAKLDTDKNTPKDWPPWVEADKSLFGTWMVKKDSKDGKFGTEIFNHKKGDDCSITKFSELIEDDELRLIDPQVMWRYPFGGRCNNRKPQNGPYKEGQYWCSDNTPWKKDLKPVNSLYDEIYKYSCSVSSPTSEGECKTYQNFFRRHGTSLSFGLGRIVWAYRISHGAFMVVAGLFMLPCVNFIARYFKETFLSHRFLHMHVWYFCHVIGGILVLFALGAGYLIALEGRLYLGFPWDPAAFVHAILGYLALLLIFVTFVQNSLRLFPAKPRKWSIMGHAIGGYIIQVILVAEILVSVFIRGSPTSIYSPCSGQVASPNCEDPKLENIAGYITISVVILKVALEVILHVLMTRLIDATDKLENINRVVAPPVMIPIVRQTATSNRAGAERRILLLIIYVAANFALTSCLVIVTFIQDPTNRFAGPTSITHSKPNQLRIDLNGIGENG